MISNPSYKSHDWRYYKKHSRIPEKQKDNVCFVDVLFCFLQLILYRLNLIPKCIKCWFASIFMTSKKYSKYRAMLWRYNLMHCIFLQFTADTSKLLRTLWLKPSLTMVSTRAVKVHAANTPVSLFRRRRIPQLQGQTWSLKVAMVTIYWFIKYQSLFWSLSKAGYYPTIIMFLSSLF